jgi:hypothetical protein
MSGKWKIFLRISGLIFVAAGLFAGQSGGCKALILPDLLQCPAAFPAVKQVLFQFSFYNTIQFSVKIGLEVSGVIAGHHHHFLLF